MTDFIYILIIIPLCKRAKKQPTKQIPSSSCASPKAANKKQLNTNKQTFPPYRQLQLQTFQPYQQLQLLTSQPRGQLELQSGKY